MAEERRSEGEPFDRLTRMADAITEALEAHPEFDENDRVIVMLVNSETKQAGLELSGYDEDADAMGDMFQHLRAIVRAGGGDLQIHQLGEG